MTAVRKPAIEPRQFDPVLRRYEMAHGVGTRPFGVAREDAVQLDGAHRIAEIDRDTNAAVGSEPFQDRALRGPSGG